MSSIDHSHALLQDAEANARRLASTGQYLEASNAYTSLLVHDSNTNSEGTSRLLGNRALMHKKLGDTDSCMSDCQEALRTHADNHKASFRLAQCMQDKFAFTDALEQLALLRQRICKESAKLLEQDARLAPTDSPTPARAGMSGWLRVVGEKEMEIRRMMRMRDAPKLETGELAAWMSKDHTLRLNWKNGPPAYVNINTPFQLSVYACTEFGFFPRQQPTQTSCSTSSASNNASSRVTEEERKEADGMSVSISVLVAGSLPTKSVKWQCLLAQSFSGPWNAHCKFGVDGRALLWCRLVPFEKRTLEGEGEDATDTTPHHIQFLCKAILSLFNVNTELSPQRQQSSYVIPVLSLPVLVATTKPLHISNNDQKRLNTNCRFVEAEQQQQQQQQIGNNSETRVRHVMNGGVALIERAESMGIPGKVWDGALTLLTFLRETPQCIDQLLLAGETNQSFLSGETNVTKRIVRIVELGAGTGAVSIGLAKILATQRTREEAQDPFKDSRGFQNSKHLTNPYCNPNHTSSRSYEITCTDLETVVPLIQENINLNGFGFENDNHATSNISTEMPDKLSNEAGNVRVIAATYEWGLTSREELNRDINIFNMNSRRRNGALSLSSAADVETEIADLIVMSDVVYAPEFYSPLVQSLLDLCRAPNETNQQMNELTITPTTVTTSLPAVASSSPGATTASGVTASPQQQMSATTATLSAAATVASVPPTVVLMAHRQRNPDDHLFFLQLAEYFDVSVVSGPCLRYENKTEVIRARLNQLLGPSVVITDAQRSTGDESQGAQMMGKVTLLRLVKKTQRKLLKI